MAEKQKKTPEELEQERKEDKLNTKIATLEEQKSKVESSSGIDLYELVMGLGQKILDFITGKTEEEKASEAEEKRKVVIDDIDSNIRILKEELEEIRGDKRKNDNRGGDDYTRDNEEDMPYYPQEQNEEEGRKEEGGNKPDSASKGKGQQPDMKSGQEGGKNKVVGEWTAMVNEQAAAKAASQGNNNGVGGRGSSL